MRIQYLVIALFAARASADFCFLGIGCSTSSGASSTTSSSGAAPSNSSTPPTTGASSSNSTSASATSSIVTTATQSATHVTADGGTSGISAFPTTSWTGPHLKPTASNGSGNSNDGGNDNNSSDNSSGGSNNNQNNSSSSTNTGAIAGGVVGGVAACAIAGGLFWFLTKRTRQKRRNADFTNGMTEHDFPHNPAAAAAAVGATTMPSAYNEPGRYDSPRRFVPQQNPHPPVDYQNLSHHSSEGYAPPYTAEYGSHVSKPAEDTSQAGMWKPDVAENKPNV
ncbi:hypothetical protein INT43_007598 [Umbelopsis isabellina]|uniref:Uncharacterized protein n=1 Tax=Mortierella isabellina TaxID=91625 RepID=A0A8H7PP15_MORIS|nr:hypothetical protein INT43_007598 [Umbelopsis isabellina]